MAIAFDAQSTLAVGTGDRSQSHNPVGTPRGVLVIVVHSVGTDTVAGVTYDGTALNEVALSPLLHTTPETGSVHAFFLGAGVPTADPATWAVDVTDAANYIAACFTVTATADTVIHDTSTFDSIATTAPSATLTITASSFVAGGLFTGLGGATSAATEVTGTVEVVFGDLGADNGEISRGDSLKTTDFAYGWTQASDDGAVLAVAIAEQGVTNYTGTAADSIASLSEAAARAGVFGRAFGDTVPTLSEAPVSVKGLIRSVAQTLGDIWDYFLDEGTAKVRGVTDTIASLTDAVGRSFAGTRSTDDTISALTEAVGTVKGLLRTVADNIASIAEEAVRSAMAMARTATDSVSTLTEAAARATTAWVRMGADSIATLTESVARAAMAKARTGADSLSTLTETATRAAMAKVRTAGDSIGSLTETVARGATAFARALGDTLGGITEAVVAVASGGVQALVRAAADTISTLSETVSRASAMARDVSASLPAITETASRVVGKVRSAADTIANLLETIRSRTARIRGSTATRSDGATASRSRGSTATRTDGTTSTRTRGGTDTRT